MKERLLQLLELEQLTPSKFADLIGVQRSSVSHVISGRNNPSYDFLQKTLKAFPGLRADWIMLGTGPMYEQMGRTGSGDLFEQSVEANLQMDIIPEQSEETGRQNVTENILFEQDTDVSDSQDSKKAEDPDGNSKAHRERKPVQVMILYDDDTFTSFRPSQ